MPSPRSTIYVIAGCNGAGKTTFAREFLPSIGVIRMSEAEEAALLARLDKAATELDAGEGVSLERVREKIREWAGK